jgi:thiol-disulfide isomerase/thioredoxin
VSRAALHRFTHVALAWALFAVASGATAGEDKPKLASLPADLSLKQLESGAELKKKDLGGKVLVLQFFASWCVGCGDLMAQLAPASEGKARFLPVSVDETVDEAKSYFKTQSESVKPLQSVAALDPEAKLAGAVGVRAIPSVVIVGADGKIRGMFSGHPDAAGMAKIKALMAP